MKNTKKIKGHSRCYMTLKDSSKLSKKLILNLVVILSLFFVKGFYADRNIAVTKYTYNNLVTQNESVPSTLEIKNTNNTTINTTEVTDLLRYKQIIYCIITN